MGARPLPTTRSGARRRAGPRTGPSRAARWSPSAAPISPAARPTSTAAASARRRPGGAKSRRRSASCARAARGGASARHSGARRRPPLAHAHDVELHVSSNRQEYPDGPPLAFHYYAHPIVNGATPPAGPVDGGTLVRVYGAHLHGGDAGLRRCRMGGTAVPASLDPSTGALLCLSPAAPGRAPATVPLRVSLNVDHFTHDQPAFTYYMPPAVAAIQPARGFSNGTAVTLSGTGLWRDDGTYCRFGAALVNASRVTDDEIVCAAPSAYRAGAWARAAIDFSEPWASQLYGFEVQLRGGAYTKGGALRLVDHNANLDLGVREIERVGAILLSLPQPAAAPASFRATFRLLMGRGGGADGLSFSYGDLAPGGFGELGGGRGLRVLFRTHTHERVEVWYGHRLLHASRPPAGESLRAPAFVDVAIQYSAAAGGLTVVHAGRTHCAGLAIDGWAPREGWRFAIGARSGGESDDHHVDDLVIEAGAAAEPEAAPVAVTLNGLQFGLAPQGFVYLRETAAEAGMDAATT